MKAFVSTIDIRPHKCVIESDRECNRDQEIIPWIEYIGGDWTTRCKGVSN